MSNKISVIVNASKVLSSFEAGSNINVYCKANDTWQFKEEIGYSLNTSLPFTDIRDYIRTVFLRLQDCKIIIGKTVSGLAYNILDIMGFAIFEADIFSDSLLNEVFSDVEYYSKDKEVSSSKLLTTPIQTEIDGVYFFNLIDLQENHPEISSKKALQPFIETTPFYTLEVICSHVPPWLANFLPQKKLTYSTDELEKNKYRVTIFKEICKS